MYRLSYSFLIFSISVSSLTAQLKNETRPNVIYIMADDLGYGDLGCYGQKTLLTPNIDKMSKEGVRFTQFYSGSTVCAPSRCALMTGKHMGNAYIRGNKELPLRSNDMTLAKMMKQKGYVTGMFGKWGLGLEGNSGSPEKQGWDQFLGYLHHRAAHRFNVDHLWEVKNGNLSKLPMDTMTNTYPFIFKAAQNFISEHKAEPFFLYLPVTIPHAEMRAPTEESLKPFVKDGKSIFTEKPFVNVSYASYRPQEMPNAAFAAMMWQLDQDVGKLLQLLKDLNLDTNTYVFFTSDNGPHQEGGREVEYFDSNGLLKGFKRDLYEGGIRVPMIAWAPGKIKPGTTCEEPFANWDVLPTLSELTNQKVPVDIDGISFYNALHDQKTKQKHSYLYWEFFERGFDQALRADDWKIVRRSMNGSKTELYNLANDISEQRDVAAQYYEKVKYLEKVMGKARVDSDEFPVKK